MPIEVRFPDGVRMVPSRRFGTLQNGAPVMIEQPVYDRDWHFELRDGEWHAELRSVMAGAPSFPSR